jgi:hypothetical protein
MIKHHFLPTDVNVKLQTKKQTSGGMMASKSRARRPINKRILERREAGLLDIDLYYTSALWLRHICKTYEAVTV